MGPWLLLDLTRDEQPSGPCLVPKYFRPNAKKFTILHFRSKHVQNILALNFLQNIGLV